MCDLITFVCVFVTMHVAMRDVCMTQMMYCAIMQHLLCKLTTVAMKGFPICSKTSVCALKCTVTFQGFIQTYCDVSSRSHKNVT